MMKELKNIKDFSEITEFVNFGMKFKQDNRALESLNKTLETEFVKVFRAANKYTNTNQWKANDIIWSGEEFYVLTKTG